MASGGLSFLKILENPVPESKNLAGKDEIYVHPMVKRSASALSTKSLEMCTESLGSETGSESGDEFGVISLEERGKLSAIERSNCRNFGRKVRRSEFPPPLTSISDSDGAVKVRHHREAGRLVIKAVSVFNCGTSFKAERTSGRLKLSLLRDCCGNNESGGVETVDYEIGRVEMVNCESGKVEKEEYEDGDDLESNDDDDDEEVGGGDCGWRRGMDGDRWPVAPNGGLNMVARCKEGGNGNKGFGDWGSSWVAIS